MTSFRLIKIQNSEQFEYLTDCCSAVHATAAESATVLVHCAKENKISAFVIYIGMAANLKNVNPIKTGPQKKYIQEIHIWSYYICIPGST